MLFALSVITVILIRLICDLNEKVNNVCYTYSTFPVLRLCLSMLHYPTSCTYLTYVSDMSRPGTCRRSNRKWFALDSTASLNGVGEGEILKWDLHCLELYVFAVPARI